MVACISLSLIHILKISDREHPVSIQLFGSDPDIMALGAREVEKAGADVVDINMGCPMQKIVRNGEGSALMKNVSLAADIVLSLIHIYAEDDRKLITELASLCDKISAEVVEAPNEDLKHTIAILDAEGRDLGMRFHGVPGGHEFNSFVLALYNAAGPGQNIGEEAEKRIATISEPKNIHIAVSLTLSLIHI